MPILELQTENRFYDYDAKYTAGKTSFIIPAQISQSLSNRCQEYAKAVFDLLNCRGVARVDMIIRDEQIYVLEINTIPGMTELSDLPAQAKAAIIFHMLFF